MIYNLKQHKYKDFTFENIELLIENSGGDDEMFLESGGMITFILLGIFLLTSIIIVFLFLKVSD